MSDLSFNLVFDNFDEDGKPIANTYNISKLGKNLSDLHWIANKSNLNQKFYSIDDVTVDENFYYIVSYNTNALNDVLDDTFIISNKAIECCKHKNLKILFVNFHEVNNQEFYALQRLVKYISDLGLNEDNFYYVNNNSKLEEYRSILNTKIHTHTSIVLFEMLANKLNKNKSIFKPNKEFFFSCHNRLCRPHRIQTLCFLKKYNILKNTDWSFIDTQLNSLQQTQLGDLTGYFTFVADEIDFFKNVGLKYSKYEITKIDSLQLDGGNITSVVTPDCYTNSYINIITETNFYLSEIHISEKSFRPFYFMQLPIFVATYGHVKYLKKKFGFDIFDDLIDHSYDLEENNSKRMKMVLEEIKRLNNNKDLVIDFYKKNKNRFEKNLDLFQKAYNKKETLNFFKSLSNKMVKDNNAQIELTNNISDFKSDGFKIYYDIIVPNKCGTRYLEEYILLNIGEKCHNSIGIEDIWNFPDLNWIVIRNPEEYLKSALKTDFINVWNNANIDELTIINMYTNEGTNHYFNNLYKTLYSFYHFNNKKNTRFVFLKDLSDFCAHKFPNKANYKYDLNKYNMSGKYYMDNETIIEYVKQFYPSQWDTIQLNLKKEIFFYNKIIENCIFFNKLTYPPLPIPIAKTIEKNSWLKKIV